MTPAPPRIFDRSAILQARRRARLLDGDPFLARIAATGIAERISPIRRKFRRGLIVDPHFAPGPVREFAERWSEAELSDADSLLAPTDKFDLAVSLLTLHTVNDLPGLLVQIRHVLEPDGLFCGAMFGGSTLFELRECLSIAESEVTGGTAPRIYPFADVRAAGDLLRRAGLALCVADCETTTVWYRDLQHLVRDLRAHAQSNVLLARNRRPLSRKVLEETVSLYSGKFGRTDGKVQATFQIIYALGWSPSETQPKPLRPGSAQMPLEEALKPAKRFQT